MSILCVIPVRGGSKGLPRKNARLVAGKPLVVWSIEQALAAGLDVLVSTDDLELAAIAEGAGADVPFLRPAELARDETATEPVVLHAIAHRTALGRRPEAVMLLQATSPIRLPGTLDRAVEQFESTGVDSLVGVVAQTPFLWRSDGDPGSSAEQSALPQYDVSARPRRQDLEPAEFFYRETGSMYLTRTEVYETEHNRIGGRVGLFVMDELEGGDIDTALDLVVAEQILLELEERRPA
ncbi:MULTISPECIES: acylneuraminate cytidylyltransferase family protein [unclassified Rathayibacter]|uniref:acylneuraminate cytidylyltransferase family protein n=1 Tax=unclassified Rathayibacter TaxID=2609250 RepID=UPI0006FF69E0|nr:MULTISPECIES: acylneuraminate cytidylyltransferase family protein [unclassified Rathayibacter]KQQ05642.1 acylneuraminate cytidylyltransferase [Rathayibacter sp. Leaf294]KQS13501.1 acylneuraminate cytidylyltransferase [Rathayibacter sp. Leaf185]